MLNDNAIVEQGSTEKSYIFWQKELDAATAREKKWREEAEKCEKRYAEKKERSRLGGSQTGGGKGAGKTEGAGGRST